MPRQQDPRIPPDENTLASIATAIENGAGVIACDQLSGGTSNAMFRLEVRRTDDSTESFTYRRHHSWDSMPEDERAEREWHVLRLLQQLGVPAPAPVLNDSEGSLTGHPGLVVSYIEGKPNLTPMDTSAWVRELARPLAHLHSNSAGIEPRSFLPESSEWRLKYESGPTARESRNPLTESVGAEIRREFSRLEPFQRCMLHFDYYAGNTIWNGKNLVAVIDWDGASIGDPAYDVAYTRMDLSVQGRPEAADEFLAEYERLTKRSIKNLRYYELLACLRALPDPADWLAGWNTFGMSLTPENVRENLAKFIDQVLSSGGN